MTSIDELREELVLLAEPDPVRTADETYRRALTQNRRGRRTRRVLVAGAAAAGVVALVAVALSTRTSSLSTVVTDDPTRTEPVRSVVVRAGDVGSVVEAFDQIWVASISDGVPGSTTITAYDRTTGRVTGTVRTEDGPGRRSDNDPLRDRIQGSVFSFAVTDRSLWVRATSNGPAIYDGEANGLYRIDPTTRIATFVRGLRDDGPVVADGDRVVAADSAGLVILDDDGDVVADRSIEEIVGESPGTFPGTNGLVSLHLDDRGLWGLHQGRSLLLRLDPETGQRVASTPVEPTRAEPLGSGDPWWFPIGAPRWTGVEAAGSIAGADLDADGAALVRGTTPAGRFNVLATAADGRALLQRQGSNDMLLLDPRTGATAAAPGPAGEWKALSNDEADQRIASWRQGPGPTTVTFWPVP